MPHIATKDEKLIGIPFRWECFIKKIHFFERFLPENLFMWNIFCNFAAVFYIALRSLTFFWETTSGKCPLVRVGYGHYEIASYARVLTYRNLVNFIEQNIVTLRCLWYMFIRMRMRMYIRVPRYKYIWRGLRCCCLFERQYQSLCKWNSKIGSPAFFIKKAIGGTSILKLRFFVCQTIFDIWITVTMIFGIILDCFWQKERKFIKFT